MYLLTCLWLSSNIEKTIAIVFGKIYDLTAAPYWGAIGISSNSVCFCTHKIWNFVVNFYAMADQWLLLST